MTYEEVCCEKLYDSWPLNKEVLCFVFLFQVPHVPSHPILWKVLKNQIRSTITIWVHYGKSNLFDVLIQGEKIHNVLYLKLNEKKFFVILSPRSTWQRFLIFFSLYRRTYSDWSYQPYSFLMADPLTRNYQRLKKR